MTEKQTEPVPRVAVRRTDDHGLVFKVRIQGTAIIDLDLIRMADDDAPFPKTLRRVIDQALAREAERAKAKVEGSTTE